MADILNIFVAGIIATLIVLVVWIALISHFFDCGWLKAIAIGIIAIVMLIVIAFILALVGISILTFLSSSGSSPTTFFLISLHVKTL
jgi:hypothetical protein